VTISLLALVLLAAGCGGDSDDAIRATTRSDTVPPVTTTTGPDDSTERHATTAPPTTTSIPTTSTTAAPSTVPPTTSTLPPAPPPATTRAEPPAEPSFVVGAVDDAARHQGPVLEQLAAAGFGALAITSYWEPGRSRPTPQELGILRDVARRAASRELRVFLSVFHRGSATTPLTRETRAQFASYVATIVREVPTIRDVIVGNEPNVNRFWQPQFGSDGESAAAPSYLALLAQVYDAAKQADADVFIWGGALGPRGSDRPGGARPTHSPATFIRELGAALRASGRARPVLDGFAYHPYPETSSTPPDLEHPNPRSRTIGLADIARLQQLLREPFGRELPILYSELGVETVIPPGKARLYRDAEPAQPVGERTQAEFYRRALELAACQEGVVGMLLFHSHDEPSLIGFQSGVYYVDGTPKSSLPVVRKAILAARAGCVR